MAGEHTRGGACGLIGFNAGNLTGGDSRMTVSLKGLPDALRGIAWPPSARTVRRPVTYKRQRLSAYSAVGRRSQVTSETRAPCCDGVASRHRHSWGTARAKWEEGAGDGRSVWSESPGLHAGYNGRDNGMPPRKGELIP